MGCICMDKFIQVRAFPLITRITVFELAERALPGACSHSMGLCACFCVYVRVRVCVAAGCWPCCMWQSTFSAPTLCQSVLKVEIVQTDVHWEKFSNSQTLRHIIIPPVFTPPVKYVLVMFK